MMMMALFEIVGFRDFLLEKCQPPKMAYFRKQIFVFT